MRLALQGLRKVHRGELDWKQLLDLPSQRGCVARMLSRLPLLAGKLEDFLRRNERDFRALVSRSRSGSERRTIYRRLRRRCRAASRLLADLPWRYERLRHLLKEYEKSTVRLRRLREEYLGEASGASLPGRTGPAGRKYHVSLIRGQEGDRSAERRLAGLRRTVEESDRVRSRLVEANLRLVVAIAKAYQRYGASLLDLVQDGNSGILRAAEKFDPDRGVPFGAYAGWWIRSSIRRAVPGHVCAIRLPEKGWLVLLRLRRSAAGLWHVLGRMPRPDEVAAAAGVAPHEALALLALDSPPLSLDVASGEAETMRSESFRAGTDELASADLDRRLLVRRVERALATLSAQQRRVIELRFGLIDGQRRTLAEVGCVLAVSGEWVRKIEARALDQLRQPTCRARLEGFLD